jgi:hypothetical protein
MRYLLIILLFASCYTEHQATRQISKIAIKQPQVLSRYCAIAFPILIDTHTDTTTIIDTVTLPPVYIDVDCDSNKGIVKVPCPPCKEAYKYRTIRTTVTNTNTAAIDSMRRHVTGKDKAISDLQSKLDRANEKIDKRKFWIWGCCVTWGLMLVALILWIYKKVTLR